VLSFENCRLLLFAVVFLPEDKRVIAMGLPCEEHERGFKPSCRLVCVILLCILSGVEHVFCLFFYAAAIEEDKREEKRSSERNGKVRV
jgi:hypothetical protein